MKPAAESCLKDQAGGEEWEKVEIMQRKISRREVIDGGDPKGGDVCTQLIG